MHISTRCRYAIKALVRLALSYGGPPVQSRDIAVFGGIPAKYLEQVMHDLRQGGLVTSTRGKNGGYVLALPPDTISFAQVREIVDGPFADPQRMSRGRSGRRPRRARVARRASRRSGRSWPARPSARPRSARGRLPPTPSDRPDTRPLERP